MSNQLPLREGPPLVMGVLNVTPDSFSDGGDFLDAAKAVVHAERMIEQGADILDIGGESTRPGAAPVSPAEQVRRTQPAIHAIRERFGETHISIDTRSAEVAHGAIQAGADIINDISALRDDPAMADLAAQSQVPVILMHMRGQPQTMQKEPQYEDIVGEIESFLTERIEFAVRRGIERDRVIIDPGIGFGKTVEHNLQILAGLDRFVRRGSVLLGASRKSFIGKILGIEDPRQRVVGTVAVNTIGLLAGVRILRVHDVAEARQTVQLCEALRDRST